MISAVPRLFLETFGFLPLRSSATGILYIAFDDRIDHSLTLAIERMSGLRVESGLMDSSEFRCAHRSLLAARFPRARMVEASGIEAMVDALTAIDREGEALSDPHCACSRFLLVKGVEGADFAGPEHD